MKILNLTETFQAGIWYGFPCMSVFHLCFTTVVLNAHDFQSCLSSTVSLYVFKDTADFISVSSNTKLSTD